MESLVVTGCSVWGDVTGSGAKPGAGVAMDATPAGSGATSAAGRRTRTAPTTTTRAVTVTVTDRRRIRRRRACAARRAWRAARRASGERAGPSDSSDVPDRSVHMVMGP